MNDDAPMCCLLLNEEALLHIICLIWTLVLTEQQQEVVRDGRGVLREQMLDPEQMKMMTLELEAGTEMVLWGEMSSEVEGGTVVCWMESG